MEEKDKSLQIMLVEDSKTDAALLKEHILLTGNHINLNYAGSLQEAFNYIQYNHIDAILLDLSLPDSHGLETVQKTRDTFPQLPIIVLTGVEDETIGVQAVRMGAGDYLIKGQVNGQLIIRAIHYSVERKAIEKVLHQANLEQQIQYKKLLQSQLQLEQSRRNYSDLFDFAPIGYFVLDDKGIIVDVNSTAIVMLESEKEDLLGKPLADCVCDEDKNIFFTNDKQVFDSSVCRQCQLKIRKNDNTYFYAELKIDPVLNSDLKAIQSRVAIIDITERKKAEQTVRRAAEKFQILSETASKLLESKNPQQIIDSLCQNVMKFLDCQVFFNFLVDEEKKCLHLNACSGIPNEIVKKLEWLEFGKGICGCVASEGKRIIAENIPLFRDPRTDSIHSLGVKAYVCHPLISQRKIIGTLAFGTTNRIVFSDDDIQLMKTVSDQVATALERMRFENALYQSEQLNRTQANRLQIILEAAPAVIWIANDTECKNITGNRAAYEISKVTSGENLSKTGPAPENLKHYKIIKDGIELEPENMPIQIVASSGKPLMNYSFEMAYDNKTSRFLFGNVIPLFDDKEKIAGAIAVFIDITELKEIEKQLHLSQQELRSANLYLESRVKERTSQLEKLIEVLQKEIVERVRVEKQLTDNQEKLRSLSSEIMIVEERERRQVATQLHDSIGQLLAFSKKELGALVTTVPKNIQPQLKEVWDMIKQAVEQTRTLTFDLSPAALYTLGLEAALEELGEDFSKKGKFKFNFVSDNCEFQLSEQDKIMLYRSVRELLINIIKHSQTKNVEINIKRHHNNVKIVITDDGIGFNVKEMSKQVKAGFGLFSIRERLESVGGNFKIISKKGKGTVVIITAPLNNVKQKKGVN
jgi:PAS domain S-box-containing protein